MNHWASSLIGLPWQYGARGPEAFDCWGFVCYVQREFYGITLPDIAVPETWRGAHELLMNHTEHAHWSEVREPVDGDIVMMARNRLPVHIGVSLRANAVRGILHCLQPSGVVFQSLPSMRSSGWGRLTYYRRIV